jgi:hypothetical protein
LKAVLKKFKLMGEFTQLEIEFSEFEEDVNMGSRELLRLCETISKFRQNRKTICIFDRDEPDIIPKVTSENSDYKHWGNNVYSIVLPVP